MSPVIEHNLLLILGGIAALAIISGWITLYFFNQWQINRFLKAQTPFYPNGESRYETIDGVRLHYVTNGHGPDILLLHGIAANIYCWRFLAPILGKNFRVWAVDIMGFGLSDKPKNAAYDLKSQAELLLKFISKHKMKDLTLVGSSMGGAIASEVAIQGGIKNLVLLNSAHDPRIFRFQPKRYPLYRKFIGSILPLLNPVVNPIFVRTIMRQIYGQPRTITDTDVAAYLQPYLGNRESHSAFFAAVECMFDENLVTRLRAAGSHLLIVWGKNDKVIDIRFGNELHDAIPTSQFLVHPIAGHHIQEEEPEWLAEHIARFVNSQKF